MKIKIIKKMLSILLIASSLAATTPFFASAGNENCSQSAAIAQDLENEIKELDDAIYDLQEKIQDCENLRKAQIEVIDEQIKADSEMLRNLEKRPRLTKSAKKFKSLKVRKIKSQAIENVSKLKFTKLKRVRGKSSSIYSKDRDSKIESLKMEIKELNEKKESFEEEYQAEIHYNRNVLQECLENRNAKMELYNKILKEKKPEEKPLDKETLENLKSKAEELRGRSSDLLSKYLGLAEEHKVTLANDHRINLMNLPEKVKHLLNKNELNQKDRTEYNEMVDTYKALKKEVENLEAGIESQRLLDQEKTKSVANLGSKSKNTFKQPLEKNASTKQLFDELMRELSKQKQIKNLKHQPKMSDQARQKRELWQKINSGSQFYSENYVASNLCWLHSATNVLNYYNSMKNKDLFKGQNAMVKQYQQSKDFIVDPVDINKGEQQDFEEIIKYLQVNEYGTLHLSISGSKTIAQELLKIHFKGNNPSPVIAHNGEPEHFVTIADYDEDTDQFLIVDSSNGGQSEAAVEWSKDLPEDSVDGRTVISLLFTSEIVNDNMSYTLNVDDYLLNSDFETVQGLIESFY